MISSTATAQLVSGQSVLYDYDVRGNRVKRYVYSNKKSDESKVLADQFGVRLYPNPSLSSAQLELGEYATDSCEINMVVIDAQSRLVSTETINPKIVLTEIETSKMESGNYFIQLQSECREPIALKLIVQ